MPEKIETVKIDMDRIYRSLGLKIEIARAALQLKQNDLAQRTGLGNGTISNIEGGRQTVSLEQLLLIARAVNVPADLLIKGIC